MLSSQLAAMLRFRTSLPTPNASRHAKALMLTVALLGVSACAVLLGVEDLRDVQRDAGEGGDARLDVRADGASDGGADVDLIKEPPGCEGGTPIFETDFLGTQDAGFKNQIACASGGSVKAGIPGCGLEAKCNEATAESYSVAVSRAVALGRPVELDFAFRVTELKSFAVIAQVYDLVDSPPGSNLQFVAERTDAGADVFDVLAVHVSPRVPSELRWSGLRFAEPHFVRVSVRAPGQYSVLVDGDTRTGETFDGGYQPPTTSLQLGPFLRATNVNPVGVCYPFAAARTCAL